MLFFFNSYTEKSMHKIEYMKNLENRCTRGQKRNEYKKNTESPDDKAAFSDL